MGRKQKVFSEIEDDYILHIPYTLNKLLRSCIKSEPINFDDIKGYNESENTFFLKEESIPLAQNDIEILENKITAFDILRDFKKEWPEKTNVWCWWCLHPFDTVPLGVPLARNDCVFKVKGCFCSFNCILAFTEEDNIKEPQYKKNEILYLIKCFYRELTDDVFSENILKAPPREMLKVMGGSYTIEQFRNKFNTFDKTRGVYYGKFNPPMMSLNIQIEEEIRILKTQKKEVKLEESRVKKAATSIQNSVRKNNIAPIVKNFTKTKLSDFFKI